MPASLFHESSDSTAQLSSSHHHHHLSGGSMGGVGGSLEDQRALQLALELSMLGLSSDSNDPLSFDTDSRTGKKSQNTTECVPVPSSEHVAEIVGRQGCKIKALRAKTNTYIKTPVRGEEPVFVVTGRKEDVASAKREILSAAEHFSQIRAQRKNNLTGGGGLAPGMGSGGLGLPVGGPNPNIPGQTTIQVRVPYRVVGLVVGPKGATIKRIQQQTNTYIITPSRDKEPIFEVTGLPESVETAKKEIEAHIATRTGGFIGDTGIPINGAPGSERERLGSDGGRDRDRDHFTNGFGRSSPSIFGKSSDAFGSFSSRIVGDNNSSNTNSSNSLFNSSSRSSAHDIFNFGSKFSDLYSSFGTSSFGTNTNGHSHASTGSTSTGFGLYESADEGLGDSPTFADSLIASSSSSGSSSAWPDFGSKAFSSVNSLSLLERRGSTSLGSEANSTASSSSSNGGTGTASSTSPTAESSDACGVVGGESGRRLSSDPLTSAFVNAVTSAALGFSALSGSTTTSSSPTESLGSLGSLTGTSAAVGSIGGGRKGSAKRDCIVCFEGEIQAALIPCGHNLFCMDCALRVCRKTDPSCPVCHQQTTQAIRIIS